MRARSAASDYVVFVLLNALLKSLPSVRPTFMRWASRIGVVSGKPILGIRAFNFQKAACPPTMAMARWRPGNSWRRCIAA